MRTTDIPASSGAEVSLPSDVHVTWLIARRGAIESLRDRTTVGVSAIWSLVVPLFVVLFVVRSQASPAGIAGAAAVGTSIAVYLLAVGIGPASGSIGVAAGLFAGEREQGNLLPLLATPASNLAIFAGKVLGAVLPALLYAFIAEVTYLVEIWLILGAGTFRQIPVVLACGMAALVPANAVLGAAVASLVSSRVRTYQSAQMLSGLALYPIMAVQFSVIIQVQSWGSGALALAVGAIVVLDALLVVLGAATWQREEVLARR